MSNRKQPATGADLNSAEQAAETETNKQQGGANERERGLQAAGAVPSVF